MTEVQAPYAVVEWPTPTPEPCAHCDAVVPVKGRVFLAIPFIPVGIDITEETAAIRKSEDRNADAK